MPNIISICGSLRSGSYNRVVMKALQQAGMSIEEAPSFAEFPLYNADIQNSTGFPAAASTLADAVRAADGVVAVPANVTAFLRLLGTKPTFLVS